MGTHTWPAMNEGMLTVVAEEKLASLMEHLNHLNEEAQMQGLRAFSWDAEVGV
jgi:hypothetical protein